MTSQINQNNSELTELERKVLQAITFFNRPVMVREIAAELNLPIKKMQTAFRSLVDKGNILEYLSEAGGAKYYTPVSSKNGLDALLSQKYADIAGSLEKQYDEIKAENENLKQRIDNLYANILTLMGIFVAVFSLIVININAIGAYAGEYTTADALFWDLLKLNIPLLISIVVLVLLMKIVLLSRRERRKRK